jgi:hypothetical protein
MNYDVGTGIWIFWVFTAHCLTDVSYQNRIHSSKIAWVALYTCLTAKLVKISIHTTISISGNGPEDTQQWQTFIQKVYRDSEWKVAFKLRLTPSVLASSSERHVHLRAWGSLSPQLPVGGTGHELAPAVTEFWASTKRCADSLLQSLTHGIEAVP